MINKQKKFTVSQIKGKKSKVRAYKESDFEFSLPKTYNEAIASNCYSCQFESGKHSQACPEYKEPKNPMNKGTKNTTCVQCHKEMIHSYGNGEWSAPFCSQPACPNFALLQTGKLS